jgi:hypothetical protein
MFGLQNNVEILVTLLAVATTVMSYYVADWSLLDRNKVPPAPIEDLPDMRSRLCAYIAATPTLVCLPLTLWVLFYRFYCVPHGLYSDYIAAPMFLVFIFMPLGVHPPNTIILACIVANSFFAFRTVKDSRSGLKLIVSRSIDTNEEN